MCLCASFLFRSIDVKTKINASPELEVRHSCRIKWLNDCALCELCRRSSSNRCLTFGSLVLLVVSVARRRRRGTRVARLRRDVTLLGALFARRCARRAAHASGILRGVVHRAETERRRHCGHDAGGRWRQTSSRWRGDHGKWHGRHPTLHVARWWNT